MSSLIEQAALRLEQLRSAGIVLPERVTADAGFSSSLPAAARAAALQRAALGAAAPAHGTAAEAVAPAAEPAARIAIEPLPSSRKVELNLAALAAGGIVTPNAPRSHTADQYRVIKRPLISNAMGKGAAVLNHGNLIMVTSALAGEGKSFNSVNLAMSIAAELDNTVMLVDADVARPSLLRMLGLPQSAGLLDLLEGKA